MVTPIREKNSPTISSSSALRDMHAYVFTYHADWEAPCYERTVPADRCGLAIAWRWIKTSGHSGFISVGCLPPHYYY